LSELMHLQISTRYKLTYNGYDGFYMPNPKECLGRVLLNKWTIRMTWKPAWDVNCVERRHMSYATGSIRWFVKSAMNWIESVQKLF